MTINKLDLVERLHHEAGLSKTDSGKLLDLIFESIKETLAKGESVKISGLGQFSINDKPSRRGRNPQSGESMIITERRVVTFKTAKVLREDITTRYAHRILEDGTEDKTIPTEEGLLRAVSWYEQEQTDEGEI